MTNGTCLLSILGKMYIFGGLLYFFGQVLFISGKLLEQSFRSNLHAFGREEQFIYGIKASHAATFWPSNIFLEMY